MAVLERKSTAKLTELLQIEQKVQKKWEEEKIFEEDAPLPGSKQASYEISPFFLWLDTNYKSLLWAEGMS